MLLQHPPTAPYIAVFKMASGKEIIAQVVSETTHYFNLIHPAEIITQSDKIELQVIFNKSAVMAGNGTKPLNKSLVEIWTTDVTNALVTTYTEQAQHNHFLRHIMSSHTPASRSHPKTPYEIRLELLQLAQTILSEQHTAAGVKNGNNRETSPTTEEIIAEADKLNVFISKSPN